MTSEKPVTQRDLDQANFAYNFANPAFRLFRPPEPRRAPIFGPYTPASSSEPGMAGQVCYDATHLYVYVGTEWRRVALATF